MIDGTNGTASTAPSITFNSPATSYFGVSTSAGVSCTWPFDSTTGVGSQLTSKMVMQWKAGYSVTWSSISSLSVSDGSNNFILLWYNDKLDKAIYSLTSRSINSPTTLTITGLTNPYPYQYNPFISSQTFTLSFFYNYYLNSITTVAQPAWVTYQPPVTSLTAINQNSPGNTLDTYVSSANAPNKVAPGAFTTLMLSVEHG